MVRHTHPLFLPHLVIPFFLANYEPERTNERTNPKDVILTMTLTSPIFSGYSPRTPFGNFHAPHTT